MATKLQFKYNENLSNCGSDWQLFDSFQSANVSLMNFLMANGPLPSPEP